MTVFKSKFQESATYSNAIAIKKASAEYDAFTRTRLSKSFILKEFLHSSDSEFRRISNIPKDREFLIKSGKALCENILEPITSRFGKPFITFGYQSKEGIEADWSQKKRTEKSTCSSPHCWDRKTFGELIYCRVDILIPAIEDNYLSKHDAATWIMHSLDVDLLMTFKRSNVLCITFSEYRPRRVWVEFGSPSKGEPKRVDIMGTEYWQNIYPHLPIDQRPKFGPSSTGGNIQWGNKNG